jgi:hypothetical protein
MEQMGQNEWQQRHKKMIIAGTQRMLLSSCH